MSDRQEPSSLSEENKFSSPFNEMADRIQRNLQAEFSGAIVIVPPSGEPIAVLLTDPKPDMEAFWAMVSGKVQVATAEHFAEKNGQNNGYGGRR